MNNASFHSKKKVESIASSFGHRVIFLPPYSSELNPIEHCWATALKKLLMGAIDSVASVDDAMRIYLQRK